MSLLSLGSNALTANQQALDLVGRNIANVNSEGYTRTTTEMGEAAKYMSGVKVDVARMTNQFLVEQVRVDASVMSMQSAISEKLATLEASLGTPTTNVSTKMDTYFEAMQAVADDPTSIAARENFIAEADFLAKRFNEIDRILAGQTESINNELSVGVETINQLATAIGGYNTRIMQEGAEGRNIYALLDERDKAVKDLSEIIGANIMVDKEGRYNIYIGQGQPLVLGDRVSPMSIAPVTGDITSQKVMMQSYSGEQVDITDQITSGEFAGLIKYRDEILNQSRAELGRIAITFAQTMNEAQRSGVDLNGSNGVNLFNDVQSGDVYVHGENVDQNIATKMQFYDATELEASSYSVKIGARDGLGFPTFEITRESDGKVFRSTSLQDVASLVPPASLLGLEQAGVKSVTASSVKFSIDGFTVSLNSASLVEGDKFVLNPTGDGASAIKNTLKRGELLAVASPVRTYDHYSNTGSGEISSVTVLDAENSSPLRMGTAILPIEIVAGPLDAFGNRTLTLNDSSAAPALTPIPGYTAISYVEGSNIQIDGYEFSITGTIQAGDRFMLERNVGGSSDNTNFLHMAELQNEETIDSGSYQDAYGQMMADVGAKTNTFNLSYQAAQSSLQVSESSLESVRGVNLDEEAARLVQLQQAYSAAAQLITTQQTIFNSLLMAVRG